MSDKHDNDAHPHCERHCPDCSDTYFINQIAGYLTLTDAQKAALYWIDTKTRGMFECEECHNETFVEEVNLADPAGWVEHVLFAEHKQDCQFALDIVAGLKQVEMLGKPEVEDELINTSAPDDL